MAEWIIKQRKDPILQIQWQLLQEGGRINRRQLDVTMQKDSNNDTDSNHWYLECPKSRSHMRIAISDTWPPILNHNQFLRPAKHSKLAVHCTYYGSHSQSLE